MSLINYNFRSLFYFNPLYYFNAAVANKNLEKYLIQFTCNICNSRMSKMFSKLAYEKGVVIIKCDGCKGNHLIADNLGWFKEHNNINNKTGKSSFNIETILKNKNEKYIKKDLQGIIEIINKEYKI